MHLTCSGYSRMSSLRAAQQQRVLVFAPADEPLSMAYAGVGFIFLKDAKVGLKNGRPDGPLFLRIQKEFATADRSSSVPAFTGSAS